MEHMFYAVALLRADGGTPKIEKCLGLGDNIILYYDYASAEKIRNYHNMVNAPGVYGIVSISLDLRGPVNSYADAELIWMDQPCDVCGRKATADNPVHWQQDPYTSELHPDLDNPFMYMCKACVHASAMEV